MKGFLGFILIVMLAIYLFSGTTKPRDPEWRVKLASEDAFRLSSAILARAKAKGCGDLEVTGQIPSLFQIDVVCNGSRRHTIQYAPSFKVDRKHVEFSSLARAYCLQNDRGRWELAFLEYQDAREAALELSVKSHTAYRVFSASGYDVSGTTLDDTGNWQFSRYLGTASNDSRRGCELGELTNDYEKMADF